MKVKELFKKVEAANEITKAFDDEYRVRVTDGADGWQADFTGYEDFKKWVKEEINKPWADVLLGNRELKEKGLLYYFIDSSEIEGFAPDFEIIKNEE